MEAKRFLGPLCQLSLGYNVIILLAVAFDQGWVRSRAAGGQFEEFPMVIRLLYLLMAIGTIYLIFFVTKLTKNTPSPRQIRAARYLTYLFALSTIAQLISRSAPERFNAIPAAIVAYTFYIFAKSGRAS